MEKSARVNMMLTATVSGSFHRHMTAVSAAVDQLKTYGVRVLSPADPRVVDHAGDFLFVASDRFRSVRPVQDRHLQCIVASDFLWLVTPDGYVGQSASMELGFAVAHELPIFSTTMPADLTLRQYVHEVKDMRSVVNAALAIRGMRLKAEGFFVDPHSSIEEAHVMLERMQSTLSQAERSRDDRLVSSLYAQRLHLLDTLGPLSAK